MFEKVNPQHPDKIADRIAGRLVDIAYTRSEGGWLKSNPKIAVEVLIGHGEALVIVETDADLRVRDVTDAVLQLAGIQNCTVRIVPQDKHLADNQQGKLRCGDNGIFLGLPPTEEQAMLVNLARHLYERFPTDGKFVLCEQDTLSDPTTLTICQSKATREEVAELLAIIYEDEGISHDGAIADHDDFGHIVPAINPLGYWTGGLNTDSGATNRKLGSDMGDAVTGGGLHGKDLSKADVSVNIMCHLLACQYEHEATASCAIGDEYVTFRVGREKMDIAYADIVERARLFIFTQFGSFEHFAEWGLL